MNRQTIDDPRVHARVLELASIAVDFELSGTERHELDSHVADCQVCSRRAAAIRDDARRLGQRPSLLPSPALDRAVQAAIAHRPARSRRVLLLAAAAVLVALLLGTMAVGSSLLQPPRTLPIAVVPNASPTAVVATSRPSASTAPSEDPVGELPTPTCPAPPQPVVPPTVSASAGHDQVVVATRGSYTTVTCTTTGSGDAAPRDTESSLAAYPGDTISMTVPIGWRFVRWEGSHRPIQGDGGDAWQPVALPDGARSIDLPGPVLLDEIVSLTVVLVSDDGRAVIELGVELAVNRAVS